MNDKYKDLYHKAVDRCVAEAERQGLTHEEGIAWLFEKEYAELIINECLDAISDEITERGHTNRRGLIIAEAVVKQHFGLEE